MKAAFYTTDIGIIKITYKQKISKIELVDQIDENNDRTLETDKIIGQINEYLDGKSKEFSIYDLCKAEGTNFQQKVWQELLNIPYGQTKTYKDIAKNIGNEKAVRAVATTIGKNPLMIITPCHRVIGSDGKMHGYAYGINLKKKLLDLEDNN